MPMSAKSKRSARVLPLVFAAAVIGSAGIADAASFGFATFSAVITSKGGTARSSGVQSSSRTAKGKYLISFSRPVNKCSYAAVPLGKAGGQASASPVKKKKKQLAVYTFSKTGAAVDTSFSILVSCSS